MKNNSKIHITMKDIIWNYLGSFLTLGMNVLLLPVLLNVLPAKDLGLWYVFSSISSLITLLDFGFSPTISRNVTCAWCGATELNKEGLPSAIIENAHTNFQLLKSLLVVSRKIYRWISGISILILLTIGTIYMYSLVNKYDNITYYLIAWMIYSISIVINMYFSYWDAFLRGIGALKQSNITAIISRGIFIIISIIGLLLGGGLIAIAIAQIISGIILRLLCRNAFLIAAGKDFLTDKVQRCKNEKEIFKQLTPNSTKYGIVSIGGFLSQRADTLLCSSFLGLETTSSYGLTMQLLNLLGSMSQMLFNSYSAQITQEKLNGNKEKVIDFFSVSIVFQFFLGIAGILTIAFIGPWLLIIIGANSVLLPNATILLLGFILVFEWNTSIFLNFLVTSNKIPFTKTSIFSGVFIVVCSYIFFVYTNLDVYSLIIGRAIIGFGFNNWYWVIYVCRNINISFFELLKIGINGLLNKVTGFIRNKLYKGAI